MTQLDDRGAPARQGMRASSTSMTTSCEGGGRRARAAPSPCAGYHWMLIARCIYPNPTRPREGLRRGQRTSRRLESTAFALDARFRITDYTSKRPRADEEDRSPLFRTSRVSDRRRGDALRAPLRPAARLPLRRGLRRPALSRWWRVWRPRGSSPGPPARATSPPRRLLRRHLPAPVARETPGYSAWLRAGSAVVMIEQARGGRRPRGFARAGGLRGERRGRAAVRERLAARAWRSTGDAVHHVLPRPTGAAWGCRPIPRVGVTSGPRCDGAGGLRPARGGVRARLRRLGRRGHTAPPVMPLAGEAFTDDRARPR